jgi:hypothetical protein
MSAWIGVIGVFVGGFLTIIVQLVVHWLQNRKARALDEARTKLLRQMLDGRDWRKLSTLSRVIGADAETTKRLLIELGARGSEKPREDNEEVWGLISKHPLENIE